MKECIISGWFYKPVTISEKLRLQRVLTVECRKNINASEYVMEPISIYDDTKPGYLGVPLRYGLLNFGGVENATDNSYYVPCKKRYKGPNLNHKDAHPDQPEMVEGVLNSLLKIRSTMLVAPTGSGKTIMASAIACKLNTPTLIVVHRDALLHQWKSDLVTKCGIAESEIGQIGGGVFQIKGKRFVIAMLQSIYDSPKYTPFLKQRFGLVIFDEVHNLGAPKLCQVLGKVDARYQLGVTATHRRRDGQDKIYKLFFGDGDFKMQSTALPLKVVCVHYSSARLKTQNRIAMLKYITNDVKRNKLICRWVLKLWKDGRNILIVSEFKIHLQLLAQACNQYGIPWEDMGHFYHGGEAFDPVCKLKKSEYFKKLQTSAKIIFATYGMVKEGISINRLDAGIDASPRAEITQLFGRIRRPFEGKRTPVWIHFLDHCTSMMSAMSKNRVAECKRDRTIRVYNAKT